mmetsp:Transcript_30551/g.98418  ORF Transcript_30551/g.98418 Transcript_30551/m.98418 type:complete len:229 (+) Transcript_30551:582-1268(+)
MLQVHVLLLEANKSSRQSSVLLAELLASQPPALELGHPVSNRVKAASKQLHGLLDLLRSLLAPRTTRSLSEAARLRGCSCSRTPCPHLKELVSEVIQQLPRFLFLPPTCRKFDSQLFFRVRAILLFQLHLVDFAQRASQFFSRSSELLLLPRSLLAQLLLESRSLLLVLLRYRMYHLQHVLHASMQVHDDLLVLMEPLSRLLPWLLPEAAGSIATLLMGRSRVEGVLS